jgi:hypothetical protein
MRMRVAFLCAQVLAVWSASPNIQANESLFGSPLAATGNNNIVFSQGSNTTNEDEPHLALMLALESLNDNEWNFHIEVDNSEGPEISIQQYVYRTQEFSGGVIFPQDKKPIVSKAAKVAVPGKISTGFVQPRTPVDVLIVYGTPQRTFASAYRFVVDHSIEFPDRFFPVKWQEPGKSFDVEKELEKEAISALNKSAGTVFFVLPKTRPDGSPNIFNIRTPRRSISFNSTTDTARFGFRSDILQSIVDEGSSGLHTLIASWDDSKQIMSLTIDGKEISK